MKILFMGADRLVDMLKRFHRAARKLETPLTILSLEDDTARHAVGVAGVAEILAGPKFYSPEFDRWMLDTVRMFNIDIVIPNIDSATVALSRLAPALRNQGVLPVVSGYEICRSMADKRIADRLFRDLSLPVPGDDFPLLAKPRHGSSSRGIVRLNDPEELAFWQRRNNQDDYVLQSFIPGREYSVDAYVDYAGRTLGIVPRERLAVSGGEVMVTETAGHVQAAAIVEKLLADTRGSWFGPLTVQVMDDGKKTWLLECNPRLGSGTTCSIEAGLAIPDWILRHRLGLPCPTEPVTWRTGVGSARSRQDHFYG